MSKIFLIYTGGTIGMVRNSAKDVLTPDDLSQVLGAIPDLHRLPYEIKTYSFEPPIDSSEMHPGIWLQLAKLIELNYEAMDGFVILHGSDTMAFTASALSFLLEGLAKPVILTGSQLPIAEIRTDAKENLITAIEIAAAKKEGHPRVPEVCIYFDGHLLRGNRATKWSTSRFEAFGSLNYPLLAEAGVHIQYHDAFITRPKTGGLRVHHQWDNSVAVLRIFPGITPGFAEAVIKSKVKGIILETFGSGNASTEAWFLSCLEEAIQKGKIVLAISQCRKGTVELDRYATGKALEERGVTSGHDMSFEAALTKLMFLLGNQIGESIRADLSKDLRGELTSH